MEETTWIGEGDASDESNWSNGLPSYTNKPIFPEDSNDMNWDIGDFTIPIDMEGCRIVITIDENCYFGGECYAPEGLSSYSTVYNLDRPPPNVEGRGDGYIWVGDTRYKYDVFMEKWERFFPFGFEAAGPDNTWDNSDGDNVYSNGANWSRNHKPQAGENPIIPDTSGIGKCTMDENSAADLDNFTIEASGEFECGSYTLDVDGNVTLGGTFTKGTGTIQMGGGGTAIISSASSAIYHLVVVDASTVCSVGGDLELFDLYVPASTTFLLNAVVATIPDMELSFTDSASCGILSSSAGTLTCTGNGSYHITLTTAAGGTPTNFWGFTANIDVTADYTTISYFGGGSNGLSSNGTIDIDNSTFEHSDASGTAVRLHISTIASFTNITIDDMGSVNAFSTSNHTGFDNIEIKNSASQDIFCNGKAEFVNSKFDETAITLSTGSVISNIHNGVANAWLCLTNTTLNKSSITNDYATGDLVTIYTGTLVVNEASACESVTVPSGSEFKIDAVGASASITHEWDDATFSGFGASAGTLTCVGNGTYGITVTSEDDPSDPTQHWDFITTLDITADYTTFSFYSLCRLQGAVDIDNCTFNNAWGVITVETATGATITSFDDNTCTGRIKQTLAIMRLGVDMIADNLILNGSDYALSIQTYGDARAIELTNSEFDETILGVSLGAGHSLISKDHDKVGGDYRIWIYFGEISKSNITNDFTSTDNVILDKLVAATGKLIVDETIGHIDMTIKDGAELEVNAGINWTQTHTTGLLTIESGGNLDVNGTSGNRVVLRSSSPGTQYFWDAQSGSTVSIAGIDVQDSNANAGEPIDATDGTSVGELQNNDNWLWPSTGGPLQLGKVIIVSG